MGKIYQLLVVEVTASNHAAAVVRVCASGGQGVGNGFIVVHPLSMACAHGPEGCPQPAIRQERSLGNQLPLVRRQLSNSFGRRLFVGATIRLLARDTRWSPIAREQPAIDLALLTTGQNTCAYRNS